MDISTKAQEEHKDQKRTKYPRRISAANYYTVQLPVLPCAPRKVECITPCVSKELRLPAGERRKPWDEEDF